MAMMTRRRSRESTDSEDEREFKRCATSEEENTDETSSNSESEIRAARPENTMTYRCRFCQVSLKTTQEKARNHTQYCASRAKKKSLKSRERNRMTGNKKSRGKKGKQSKTYWK